MILTINGQQVALKKGASIEYVSENRIFTDADDYSLDGLLRRVSRKNFAFAIKFIPTYSAIRSTFPIPNLVRTR